MKLNQYQCDNKTCKKVVAEIKSFEFEGLIYDLCSECYDLFSLNKDNIQKSLENGIFKLLPSYPVYPIYPIYTRPWQIPYKWWEENPVIVYGTGCTTTANLENIPSTTTTTNWDKRTIYTDTSNYVLQIQ